MTIYKKLAIWLIGVQLMINPLLSGVVLAAGPSDQDEQAEAQDARRVSGAVTCLERNIKDSAEQRLLRLLEITSSRTVASAAQVSAAETLADLMPRLRRDNRDLTLEDRLAQLEGMLSMALGGLCSVLSADPLPNSEMAVRVHNVVQASQNRSALRLDELPADVLCKITDSLSMADVCHLAPVNRGLSNLVSDYMRDRAQQLLQSMRETNCTQFFSLVLVQGNVLIQYRGGAKNGSEFNLNNDPCGFPSLSCAASSSEPLHKKQLNRSLMHQMPKIEHDTDTYLVDMSALCKFLVEFGGRTRSQGAQDFFRPLEFLHVPGTTTALLLERYETCQADMTFKINQQYGFETAPRWYKVPLAQITDAVRSGQSRVSSGQIQIPLSESFITFLSPFLDQLEQTSKGI